MKIRKGFVSNSSSSSFILATKAESIKAKVVLEIDMQDHTEYTIKTKQELLNYFKEDRDCETEDIIKEDEYNYKDYQKMLKAIEEGKTVYCGSVSSEGEPTESILYDDLKQLKFAEDIEIIDYD